MYRSSIEKIPIPQVSVPVTVLNTSQGAMKMQRLIVLVAVFLPITGTVIADENPQAGPGIPPKFIVISAINPQQGELALTAFKTMFVAEERIKRVENNGRIEEVVERIRKPVFESYTETVSLDTADVYEAGGKKLDRETVLKRAVAGAVAVASANGEKVADDFLKALAKDTLVIVAPLAPPVVVPSRR